MSWDKSRSHERSRTYETEDSKKEFYDSANIDSGIVSGGNIISDSCLSGEISPPPEAEDPTRGKTDPYVRLDSGVDVGLSDQLSGLDIHEATGSKAAYNVPSLNLPTDVSWQHHFKPDEDGDTSLHIAVICNRYSDLLSLVRMIPEAKYLNIRNDMRQTALHLAVLTSQMKMVKLLVAAGAATDSVDHHGNTPLHLATRAGDLELVKELTRPPPKDRVDNIGLKYRPQPLPKHAVPPEINMYNYEGLACVHLALMGGHVALLKHLVWFGADINAQELKGGLAAVHMASTMGDVGLVKTLVHELHADPCPLTYSGESPFSLVRGASEASMVDCLIQLGSYSIGDSEDEDEQHLGVHYESEDEDMQTVDRSTAVREFQMGVTA